MALPNLMIQHAHAQAALSGIEHLFKLKTEQNNDEQPLIPDKINGLYKIHNIKFTYSGESNYLKISNLVIKPGERISILGPIGSGKSTFLRLLSGLYEPTEGKILLDDLNLAQIQRQTLNRYIGYLQQDHRLFQGTLRENLLIGLPDPGDNAIFEVLKKTGMDKFVSSHPKGLSRKISEGGKGLSGGQKQLLAFTRLILCDPQIYILDEPTAAMDEEQERRCLDVLWNEAQKGKTLIIVTHKPILLALVNRIIVISDSKIVLDGSRDAIINKLKNKKENEPA
jgi:ATP-binding cassette subfamily C protein LapB